MKKQITERENTRANEIKNNFLIIHQQISELRSQMKELNQKSSEMITELEKARTEESEFIESLNDKYGEGFLDPFEMVYILKENE